MKAIIRDTTGDTKSQNSKNERLSPDGKWRSFPKVPNLLQYVSTGLFFARVKVNGKLIRRGLDTDVFTTAKLKLGDFKKAEIEKANAGPSKIGTVGQALKIYLRGLNDSHEVSEDTKRYRRYCVRALLKSWPGLRSERLEKIVLAQCQKWAKKFAAEKDEQYFNNTLSVLRSILEYGGISKANNPARQIKRLGVKPTELQLPEPEQFQKLVEHIETSGAGKQRECADLVRFLAFSGCRISEARKVTWADVDISRLKIRVWNAKRAKKSNAHATREVPIIPPMRELLEKLWLNSPAPSDPVCAVGECEKSLVRGCKLVGIPKLTHHDLRHLFATRCIEAGVDIPTVSRWLGHSDGGALAMKTYGHLRREHSAAMAQRVTFA
jgi:integrase